MASEASGSSDYIQHHLQNETLSFGVHPFWTLNFDTLVTSVVLGIVGFGLIWWVVRGATSGVPNKRQAFVELAIEFVDTEVKSIFHGDRHSFVAPAALTVAVWILLMNSMDFLPVDWFSTLLFGRAFGFHHWRAVPTADVSTTFALSISVWLLMIFFSFKVKGVGGFLREFVSAPFHAHALWAKIILAPANIGLNLVEYVSRPLSHSLRLYGNMYAGEIIFLLLGLWAGSGVTGTIGSALLGTGWAIFHILIVALQAYIFMMLTVVYIAFAYETH